jgi:hypothetical protein
LFHPWDIQVFANLPGQFVNYFGMPGNQSLKASPLINGMPTTFPEEESAMHGKMSDQGFSLHWTQM